MNELKISKWHKELEIYKSFRSTFILEGNINDVQQWVDEEKNSFSTMPLEIYMDTYLQKSGYEYVVFYNRIDGFYSKREDVSDIFKELLGEEKKLDGNINEASSTIRELVNNKKDNCAIIINYASILLSNASNLSEGEMEALGKLFLASRECKKNGNKQNRR